MKEWRKYTVVLAFAVLWATPTRGQSFPLSQADLADSAALARSMPRLAELVLAQYEEKDSLKRLDNLFRLQSVTGQYQNAQRSLATLEELQASAPAPRPDDRARNLPYLIYAKAKAAEAEGGGAPGAALPVAFRQTFDTLDDQTSALVIRPIRAGTSGFERSLRRAIQSRQDTTQISLEEALGLLRAYHVVQTYRYLGSSALPLVAEDDRKRYMIENDLRVSTGDGGTLCAMIVRPRSTPGKLPTLLEFTIYADSVTMLGNARRSASHGYVGVSALSRGKGCSPDSIAPYRHEASDIPAMINWIAAQSWSDGRVGMFGGSYSGFTAWAATKRMPEALKAIMVGAPVAPGIDVPMEGNVSVNFVYAWPFYAAYSKGLDTVANNDFNRWYRLNREWYVSGGAYRELDQVDGKPNPVFDDWLRHPSYDAYWQAVIPSQKEFARIKIPVLQTAGYYYGGPGAAVHYFSQHYKYNPQAEHYLLIGPYDHFQAQRGVVDVLGDTSTVFAGYEIDPVARIDITADLRFQWFDYVLKGKPRPALLQDKVNYQVMGANTWKHAPSIATMSNGRLRFYLSAEHSGEVYRLSKSPARWDSAIPYSINLADRSTVDRNVPGGGVLDVAVDTMEALEFISDPLPQPAELSGLFSGHLDFITNKKDFDFSVALFELTPAGKYLQLPPYWARASYVGDLSHRRLLAPGKRQQLNFQSIRLMSRRCEAGSRIVAVLQVIKNPGQQINYGTGREVSDETIADAAEPVTIKWFESSYLELPVKR
jgi:putative CocE/NonD family hydrolase